MTARRLLTGWLQPLLLVVLLSGCIPLRRPAPREGALPTRVVLALDGIDYRDIVAARERGLFGEFHAPSRLVSTFPSISDIAWHEIFTVQPPRGYQRVYYSAGYNSMIGTSLDAIRPIEFEDRMDMAFGAKFHHLGAYIISGKVARGEVDAVVRDFFNFSGRSTVYMYNVGPDALQHTRGNLTAYLAHLDSGLVSLQTEYRRRTGRELEVVVLSDHGHNRAIDAKFLPIKKSLEAHGFREAEKLRTPMDVAFSVDGVTTGFGVFAAPDSLELLADVLAKTEGVAIVSRRINDSVFVVEDANQSARIERRKGAKADVYRYVTLAGDPLHHAAALERMRAERALDAEGFADAATWIRYTADAEYPVAVVRIVRGHTDVTLNPAPILVSVSDEYRVGVGMVAMAIRVRPLGGTHGALNASSSLGVLMTNFQDTHDDMTTSVGKQLGGFADFGAVQIKSSGARLASTWLMARDARGPFYGMLAPGIGPTSADALELWITEKDRAWAGSDGMFRVEARRMGENPTGGDLLATSSHTLPSSDDGAASQDGWMMTPDRLHYLLPLRTGLFTAPVVPNATYQLRVSLHRPRSSKDTRTESINLVTLEVRTNERGELWPY